MYPRVEWVCVVCTVCLTHEHLREHRGVEAATLFRQRGCFQLFPFTNITLWNI